MSRSHRHTAKGRGRQYLSTLQSPCTGSQAFSNLFGWASNSRGPRVRSLLLEPSDSPNVIWEPAAWGKHKGAKAQRGRDRLREGVCKREGSETEKERHGRMLGVRKECWKESSEREDGGSNRDNTKVGDSGKILGKGSEGTLLVGWGVPREGGR